LILFVAELDYGSPANIKNRPDMVEAKLQKAAQHI